MDKNDDLKKKADEFMKILKKKHEEEKKLEREKKINQIKHISESIHDKHTENIKEDIKLRMQLEYESFKRSHELHNPNPIGKQDKPINQKKERTDWGGYFLMALILLGGFAFLAGAIILVPVIIAVGALQWLVRK